MVLRAAIYCRISKLDNKRDKVADQETDCRAYAAKRGYDVVKVYTDDGVSAFEDKGRQRDSFLSLLTDAEARGFDVIVATYEDRFDRGTQDKMALATICAESKIVWDTVHDGRVDPSTDEGELFAYFRGWVARRESRVKTSKIRDQKQRQRDAGHPGHGPRPFGYSQDRMHLVPQEAEVVRRAMQVILDGGTKWQALTVFNESGLLTTRGAKLWRPGAAYDILIRFRNAALVEHAGEVVGEGGWPALCSREQLDAVRAIVLSTKAPTTTAKRPKTLLSNIARCWCGEAVHAHGAHWRNGPDRTVTRVYRCRTRDTPADRSRSTFEGKHVAIKITLLDDLVRMAVVAAYFSDPEASTVKHAEEQSIGQLYDELGEVAKQRSKLVDLYQTTDTLTKAQYTARARELNSTEEAIKAEVGQLARKSAHAVMLVAIRKQVWDEAIRDEHGLVLLDGDQSDAVFQALCKAYDDLDLESQRRLASGLEIVIRPGRGIGRVSITRPGQTYLKSPESLYGSDLLTPVSPS